MHDRRISARLASALRRLGVAICFLADTIEASGLRAAFGDLWRRVVLRRVTERLSALRPKPLPEAAEETSGARGGLPGGAAIAGEGGEGLRPGVLFIGYAEGALGLGQAFRMTVTAAATAGIDLAIHPVRKAIETRLIGPFMPERYDTEGVYAIQLIEVATDQLSNVRALLSQDRLTRPYTILRPYWELPRAPEAWRESLGGIDEIWAPNQFIADAFAPIFERRITVMPPAIEDIAPRAVDRGALGLPAGRFLFFFSFDYHSSPFRKNPLGVIEAFAAAFPRGDEPVGLMIKSNGQSSLFPQIRASIEAAARRDARIALTNAHIDREAMLDLIGAADVYVSLHRAEGLGLGMVEAMTLGRIVVATDFSGSTDFLNTETGLPVPYRLRPILEHEYPWSSGQAWAEPDLEAAAAAMRHLAEHRGEAEELRRAARQAVRRRYDPAIVGRRMKARLDAIAAARRA